MELRSLQINETDDIIICVIFSGASHFVSFTCEPSKLLPMLIKKFTQKGGVLVQRKIGHFTELHHFDVIVNCTGLEARKLAKDANVHPIRGQVSRVLTTYINNIQNK